MHLQKGNRPMGETMTLTMTVRRPSSALDPRGVFAFLAMALLLSACQTTRFAPERYELRSISDSTALRPRFTTSVYAYDDQNTVNIFMTDLDPRALRSPDVGDPPVGHLVHIHLFLRPRAGRTPIDDTAMTATVTHMVLAAGEVGIYAGGGFFNPASSAGDRSFTGTLTGGTLRLERSTTRFRDLLGASTLTTTARAKLDPAQAEALRVAMRRWSDRTRPVSP